ncbi:MAG TPA: hypothetical protein VF103_01425, partial [Polyangiaceae bacterium]
MRGRAGEPRTPGALAVLAAALIIALSALSALLPVVAPAPGTRPTPEHVAQLGLVDSRVQSRAHRIIVLVTAAAALGFVVSRRARAKLAVPFERIERSPVARAASFVIPPLLVLLAYERAVPFVAGLGAAALVLVLGARFRREKWFSLALVGVGVGYALLVLVPGFFVTPDLSDPWLRQGAEWHYSIVVSQGDRLARGLELFENITPHYGLLGPTLLALYERSAGFLSFGGHVRLIQVTELVFCAAALCCHLAWSGRRVLPTVVAMVPVLAW